MVEEQADNLRVFASVVAVCVIVLGPVVQSIVSLKSLFRGQLVKCFTTLQPNTLIFFVEKNERNFSHFFNKKYWPILNINV